MMVKKSSKKRPDEFLEKLKSITAKRAKTVIDHLLKHGSITTEELKEVYGYDHPPRAVRDVREQGIPVITFTTKGKNNRSIAAYKFGDPSQLRQIVKGRNPFSKQIKEELVKLQNSKCAVCSAEFESRYLQIDHCVPFEIAGETEQNFMLLCRSCNRAKSWSCEHCLNWKHEKDIKTCRCCYWANPVHYTHIALRLIRRLDLTWTETEVIVYEKSRTWQNKKIFHFPIM
jgi:hypothetical protein